MYSLRKQFMVLALVIGAGLGQLLAQSNFAAWSGNPVLDKGSSGTWDSYIVFLPKVFMTDSMFYLFYTGNSQHPSTKPNAIGFASSTDGRQFTKSDANPILSGDDSGFDSTSVTTGALLMDGDSLVLYYNGWGNLPGQSIGRATATQPSGPWSRTSTPLLRNGGSGEWDSGYISVNSVLKTATQYLMFYTGGFDPPPGASNDQIGLAVSDDGINWTKYDDPATVTTPYAESDPVLKKGPTGSWDDDFVWLPSVMETDNGFEMYYGGGNASQLCFGIATSSDGIHWTKSDDNPFYTVNDDPYALSSEGIIESQTLAFRDPSYYMYYDYGLQVGQIGLATALRDPMAIRVPDDQPTIQAGIDAAIDGDTVLVAENTYFENINFRGKAITVASQFILDQDTSHISKTIIDGSQPTDPDSGTVVYFEAGTDSNSVLTGFTITGGSGTKILRPNLPLMRYGGGIFIADQNGGQIAWNRISGNKIDSDLDCGGGGIHSGAPGGSGFSIIEHNIIENNTLTGTDGHKHGCAIWMGNNGRIAYNTINENTSATQNGSSIGAIRLNSGGDFPVSFVTVCNNTITENLSKSAADWAAAGGINSSGTLLSLTNNLIRDNEVNSDQECFAAGVHVAFQTSSMKIQNNFIINNHCTGSAPGIGGGIYLWGSGSQIVNNTIAGNSAAHGGALVLNANSDPIIRNTIFYQNTASVSGSQIWFKDDASDPDFHYCDLESGQLGFGFENSGDTFSGAYQNNMDSDPLFEDNVNYYLTPSSPCIDAGDPEAIYNDPEDPANSGYALSPAQGTVRNDMGATGGANVTAIEDQNESNHQLPQSFMLYQNYPNPFNPKTVISYQLPAVSQVDLSIYNILGQKVANLVSGKQKAGTYKIEWDGSRFSSGIYLYNLTTDKGYAETKKLVLLK